MKINCTVIKDILPLYFENMVSEDTIRLVDEHLTECLDCKKELHEMKKTNNLPIDINTTSFKSIKAKLFKEKFKAIILSIMLTFIVIILAINYLTKPRYISYSQDIVSIKANDNGTIFANFADNVSDYNISKYISEDGSGYIYHMTTCKTIWNKRISDENLGTVVLNPNGEKVNSIYYYSDNRGGYSSTNSPGDILIYGQDVAKGGGVVTMPRLVLSYYLLIAVVLTIFCLIIFLVSPKYKKVKNTSKNILFIPLSYIIGHLCIKGFNSSSYSASRDFYTILLISIPIYLVLIIISNFYKEFKDNNQ